MLLSYLELIDTLGKVVGRNFAQGEDIVGVPSNALVPKRYESELKRISMKLQRNGGKARFRVTKNRLKGFHVKDYLDLAKRLTEVMVPKHGMLSVEKFRKTRRVQGKVKQDYFYNYIWKK